MDFQWTRSVGGKMYRQGFLKAAFGDMKPPKTPQELRILQRIMTLSDYGTDLYHYTNLDGFKGIIEAGGFWASDNRFLNDAQEQQDGQQFALEVLAHRIRKATTPEFKTVLAAVRTHIQSPRNEELLVTCFSTARDSLDHWRGYSGGGGVCLRLRTPKDGERDVIFGPQQLPFRVVYRHRAKAEMLLHTIRSFEQEYLIDRGVMPDWPDHQDESYTRSLYSVILSRTVGFKNISFENEKEVRLVITSDYLSSYANGLRFRSSRFGLIPYICTGDLINSQGLLPIGEVVVGPDPRQELVAESVTKFLHHHGYDVPVTRSAVPYRC